MLDATLTRQSDQALTHEQQDFVRAIQVHGALGVSDDTPLAFMWRSLRMLRLADGPDEVHKMVIALREMNRWANDPSLEGYGGPAEQQRTSVS